MYKKILKLFPVNFKKRLPREVALIHIGEKESKRLNRVYRKKNKPANVLSFRYSSQYGEILVCPAVIRQEAKKAKISYTRQMTRMVIHGMVHLSGLHHEKSREAAKKFDRLEQKMINKILISRV
jgi:probable rRNA maturation factor